MTREHAPSAASLPLPADDGGHRFPGFDVMARQRHWDTATRAAVYSRMHGQPAVRFFTRLEEATAGCLLDLLVGQPPETGDVRVDLVRVVDARLAENQTDGWHYDTMPRDDEAWRATLKALNQDAHARFGRDFAACTPDDQCDLIEAVRTCTLAHWHDLPPSQVWSLWTRYAATAFYAHPAAWNEIGFDGPAYPRGYKALGIDKREPFEVPDARPDDDPLRRPGPERRERAASERLPGHAGGPTGRTNEGGIGGDRP